MKAKMKISLGFIVIAVFLLTMIFPASAIDVIIIPGNDNAYRCIIPIKSPNDFIYPDEVSQSECESFGGTWELINSIPEFPTVALPVIAVIGLMFLFSRIKGK